AMAKKQRGVAVVQGRIDEVLVLGTRRSGRREAGGPSVLKAGKRIGHLEVQVVYAREGIFYVILPLHVHRVVNGTAHRLEEWSFADLRVNSAEGARIGGAGCKATAALRAAADVDWRIEPEAGVVADCRPCADCAIGGSRSEAKPASERRIRQRNGVLCG